MAVSAQRMMVDTICERMLWVAMRSMVEDMLRTKDTT
jgi:hypothetical protein